MPPIEKVNVEDALALVARKSARGATSQGKKALDEFIGSKAAFGRIRFTNEKERASKVMSIRKAVDDEGLTDKVWIRPDGASVILFNLALVNDLPEDEAKAITEAYEVHKASYANVGRKK